MMSYFFILLIFAILLFLVGFCSFQEGKRIGKIEMLEEYQDRYEKMKQDMVKDLRGFRNEAINRNRELQKMRQELLSIKAKLTEREIEKKEGGEEEQ